MRVAIVPEVPLVPGRWWTLSELWNVQWRPCFFLKILLKAFLLRLPEDSLSSPPSSSAGLLLGEGWTPIPRQLLDRLDEAEDEKVRALSTESGVTQRERVEMEEAMTVAGLPLSSPRLELFSRDPPVTLEVWRGWSLDGRKKGLALCWPRESLKGRAESESERFMMSLKDTDWDLVWTLSKPFLLSIL